MAYNNNNRVLFCLQPAGQPNCPASVCDLQIGIDGCALSGRPVGQPLLHVPPVFWNQWAVRGMLFPWRWQSPNNMPHGTDTAFSFSHITCAHLPLDKSSHVAMPNPQQLGSISSHRGKEWTEYFENTSLNYH